MIALTNSSWDRPGLLEAAVSQDASAILYVPAWSTSALFVVWLFPMQSHAKGENKRGIKLHKHHPTARSLPLASKQDIRSRNKTGFSETSLQREPANSNF